MSIYDQESYEGRNALSNPYVTGFSRQILHTSSAADASDGSSGFCGVDDSGATCRNQHSSPLRQYPISPCQVICRSTDRFAHTFGVEHARLGLIIRSQPLLIAVKKFAAVSCETTSRSQVVTTGASRFRGCGSVHVDMSHFEGTLLII